MMRPLDELVEAYRTGGGVPFEAYGSDMREGLARMNRPLFLGPLGREYLPSIPDVHRKLSDGRPARVADVGCGAGWSSIGIALAYPNARVDGFDLDAPSVELARANARAAGVSDRVTFHVRDAGDDGLGGQYDLVTAFECIHDMTHPVKALEAMKRLAADDGAVIVMDERACDSFTPDDGGIDWMLYGFSVLHCLPVGMTAEDAAGTGTVMRCGTFERYARHAGFGRTEILPIENEFFRFYRLHR
jgi:SAM-dependent methyltransferase